MTKPFALRPINGDKTHEDNLRKKIRDRCHECFVPRCWLLKDKNDDGQIYLEKPLVEGSKGEHVQLRRLLFLNEYKQLPPLGRVIKMRCGRKQCINPAHMRVKGFEPSYQKVYAMIERNLLSPDDLERYYLEDAT